MSKVGKELIQGLNECLEYEQGKRHDLRTFAEVVFCKDCKYWEEDVPHNAYCEFMKLHGFEPDDFCSRGEKKDDNY